ncbi:uncharacterized protein LOC123550506 [Mercenaria mercenaria]|uniref:uncharacterized protein LOC123550506 n=1 Tax=Mercenaria mercenaria TaxID=6596 RepID=UPI00234ED70A|nr:uncharacterized protein LOC123550506 [Mercenaria mercenaria]
MNEPIIWSSSNDEYISFYSSLSQHRQRKESLLLRTRIGVHLGFVKAWHGLNFVQFHCWSLTASETDQTPLDDDACSDSFNVKWVIPPPDEVRAQENFSVTYNLEVKPIFYEWAVYMGYFDGVGPGDLTTAPLAKTWCENTVCPTAINARKTNCCVWHVNLHSCPKGLQNLCGPWLKHDGSTYTHSAVIVGPVDQGNWTSMMPGIVQYGSTDLIAHFKIANMQLALQATLTVLPRTDCGPLENPTNGNVTFEETFENSEATYTCNVGYVLSGGDSKRVCQADGNWSTVDPMCLADCGPLNSPANGTVNLSSTTKGSTATYSCLNGLTVKTGDMLRTCASDGSWTGTKPVCDVPGRTQEPTSGCKQLYDITWMAVVLAVVFHYVI